MTPQELPTLERHIATPNGKVFVREILGNGPPIVLMHGFPDDLRIYDELLPRLAPRHAVAFDWHGYGRSDRSGIGEFTMQEHCDELAAVLDQLEIGSAVLVGHDASGPDAVVFAVAHPQRVARLVLLNTYLGHLPSLKLPEMIWLLAEPALAPLADAMMADEGQRLWLLQQTADRFGMDVSPPRGIATKSILPQFFGGSDQPHALPAIRAWTGRLFESLNEQDRLIERGVLRALAVPVSVIFGGADRYLNPGLASEIAGLFSDSATHILPEASHWPQHDEPDAIATLLDDIAGTAGERQFTPESIGASHPSIHGVAGRDT